MRDTLAQLRRAPDKREVGGHGDFLGFRVLIDSAPADADLFEVALPMRRRCSTCRFLTPEFHERMPCYDCVTDANLPKWRPA